MTREEIEAIFDEVDSKWTGDNAFKGLTILSKYIDIEKDELITWCGHEVLLSIEVDKAIEVGVTKEDFEKLAKLNWMIGCDASNEHLAVFV